LRYFCIPRTGVWTGTQKKIMVPVLFAVKWFQ
jgi:hypothetical protein